MTTNTRSITMDERIENWFSYHAPSPEQVAQYQRLRDAAKVTAYAIVANTPPSADQTAALRLLRESVMTANTAIACGGK